MAKITNVLSLFDGMSVGQIALKELGIIPDVYYASEIDRYAIAQTKLNFPNTIHLGSVVDVDVTQLQPIGMFGNTAIQTTWQWLDDRSNKAYIQMYVMTNF